MKTYIKYKKAKKCKPITLKHDSMNYGEGSSRLDHDLFFAQIKSRESQQQSFTRRTMCEFMCRTKK